MGGSAMWHAMGIAAIGGGPMKPTLAPLLRTCEWGGTLAIPTPTALTLATASLATMAPIVTPLAIAPTITTFVVTLSKTLATLSTPLSKIGLMPLIIPTLHPTPI